MKLLLAAIATALATAAAVALVAFVVVPLFVHRELHEAAPGPRVAAAASSAPSAPAAPLERTLAAGDLKRLTAVDYGTGRVLILDVAGMRYLRFDNVDIAGAPDMYVYLSDRSDGQPGTYIDLGKLKATTGSFNYEVPAAVDLGAIRSVVVWCRHFSTTVTFATLG